MPPSDKPEQPSEGEIRNAALCLIAADSALCDEMTPEVGIEFARRLEGGLDEEPWADGKHSGDCTKQAYSCIRCQIEEAEAEARARYET